MRAPLLHTTCGGATRRWKIGGYFRPNSGGCLAFRVGKAKAITATARKLAILVYHTLKGDLVYQDPGAEAYDAKDRVRTLRRLHQRAEHLGFTLVDLKTGELAEGTVS